MSEQANAPAPAPSKPALLIESLDTTKDGIKLYLEDAAATRQVLPQSSKAMRLAVFRFVADTCRVDGAMRQQAWKQFCATPEWFGTNTSAGRQALGYASDVVAAVTEIEA